MCGIAGIYSSSPEDLSPAVVESMLGKMIHRGPDGHGLEVAGSAVLGHRRLKILDLTDAARQPFFDPSGEEVAFFQNGALKRVSLSGGRPIVIAQVPDLRRDPGGGHWAPDGSMTAE